MATCPRCHDFLDDHHACRGVMSRRLKEAFTFAAAGLSGLVLGAVVFAGLGSMLAMRELEVFGMVAGPIVAIVLVRALRSA